jgi:uncharacterized protein
LDRAQVSGMSAHRARLGKLPSVAALIVALAGGPLLVVVPRIAFGEDQRVGLQIALQLLYCALAAGIVWVVLRHERLPLSSIGLRRPDWLTLPSVVLLDGVLVLLPLVTTRLFGSFDTRDLQTRLALIAMWPLWFRIFVGLSAGIVEELLYRGYALERLAAMSGRRWVGAGVSMLVFALAHVPAWGLEFALAADLPFSVVMTAFYLWRRALVANMLAHSSTLVIALVNVGR